MGLLDSYFRKLILRIVFENMKNTIPVLFENSSYYLNLVFSIFVKHVKILNFKISDKNGAKR